MTTTTEQMREALERCKAFLEDMHVMSPDWTVKASQPLHADVSDLLAALRESAPLSSKGMLDKEAAQPAPVPVAQPKDFAAYMDALLKSGSPQVIQAAHILMDWYQGVEPSQPLWSYDISPPQGFIDYVAKNYNGIVEFYTPEWHAKRLWNAAMKNAKPPFVQYAAPAQQEQAPQWTALPIGTEKVLRQAKEALTGPVADGLARRAAVSAIDLILSEQAPQPMTDGQVLDLAMHSNLGVVQQGLWIAFQAHKEWVLKFAKALLSRHPAQPVSAPVAITDEREAFRKWREDNDHNIDSYNYPEGCMFMAWQASALLSHASQAGIQSAGSIATLIGKLEHSYDFECEAGPLRLCRDWIDLKRSVLETLTEVDGCFEAAYAEGLADALAGTTDERLRDLVTRRLLWARQLITAALSAAPVSQDIASLEQNAELVKDAERMNWLEKQEGLELHHPVHMPNTITENRTWLITDIFNDAIGEGKTLRAAIDAAIASATQGGGTP